MQRGITRRELLKAGLLVAAAGSAGRALPLPPLDALDALADRGPLPWKEGNRILEATTIPMFPDATFLVTDYGAVGDGSADDTAAFRSAIEDCSGSGGGHVVAPAGIYSTGAINLLSGVDLHLESGCVLQFNGDVDDYPLVLTRYEGIECMNHSPMVYAYGQTGIALTGQGILDAAGTRPWNTGSNRAGILEPLVAAGVPPEERIVPNYGSLRSTFVEPYACRNVLIQGVTLRQSQFWQLHPTLSTNVTVDSVTTGGTNNSNTDGCDPESCDHVVIRGSTLDAHDDCIAIKSGRDDDGRRVNTPSQNLVIFDCLFQGPVGGLVCGSELTGGIRNVYAYNCQSFGSGIRYMLYVKSNTRRGGYAENLNLHTMQADGLHSGWAFAQMDYSGQVGDYRPVFRDWSISHSNGDVMPWAFRLNGLADDHITDFGVDRSAFDDVADPVDRYSYVDHIHFKKVTINGETVDS